MTPTNSAPGSRIDIIDALRGSALLGILLLHSVEHFDFLRYPENPPQWLHAIFRHMGQFYSILYGVAFFVVQCVAAHWWIKRFQYGPLEWLWRSATLLTFKIPFLRQREEASSIKAKPLEQALGT